MPSVSGWTCDGMIGGYLVVISWFLCPRCRAGLATALDTGLRRRAGDVSMPSVSGWTCDDRPNSAIQDAITVSMPSVSGWTCDIAFADVYPAGRRVSMPSVSGWTCDGSQD